MKATRTDEVASSLPQGCVPQNYAILWFAYLLPLHYLVALHSALSLNSDINFLQTELVQEIIVSKTFHYFAGYLNKWIEQSQKQDHQVFLGADSKFLDAIADPDLSPLSQDKWNLWMQCSASDKAKVSQTTGMRSDLNLPFDCAHPKSLLPALDASHILMCIDHGFTRVVENLVMKVVRTCLDLESRLVHYLFSFLMSYCIKRLTVDQSYCFIIPCFLK